LPRCLVSGQDGCCCLKRRSRALSTGIASPELTERRRSNQPLCQVIILGLHSWLLGTWEMQHTLVPSHQGKPRPLQTVPLNLGLVVRFKSAPWIIVPGCAAWEALLGGFVGIWRFLSCSGTAHLASGV
jgi:hypothetical protein